MQNNTTESMKILQLDHNHPLIEEQLLALGCRIDNDFSSSYEEVCEKIHHYDGIIIRSRLPMDEHLMQEAKNLKFIARVGAGMENIDLEAAKKLDILPINSPEGNQDAVAEHVLGMLLCLSNRLIISSNEVKQNIWKREENRGDELLGQCVGIIGYGHMGKATAKRLKALGMEVVFYDIKPDLSDEYATQVSLANLQARAQIVSLHVPLTPETKGMIDDDFIQKMQHDFYVINTARGKNLCCSALVKGLKSGKIKAAALDVLEYEKASFESISSQNNPDLAFLLNDPRVLITPHIAGWTIQSKHKLAQIIVDKIKLNFLKA